MINEPVASVLAGKQIHGLIVVPPKTTVAEAVTEMARRAVGAVLIGGSSGTIDGIFTERDVMCRVVDQGLDAKKTSVDTVMSRSVRHVLPSATVEEVLRLMIEHGHRHILVDDGDAPRGLLSIRDLMRWLILPEEPVAHEGRGGVIHTRAEQAIRELRHVEEGSDSV
jgi:CBS domain-containing protein